MDNKQFKANLSNIGKYGIKVRELITECAMFAWEQVRDHGNVSNAQQLIAKVRELKGARSEALQAWFLWTCPVYSKNDTIHFSKEKSKGYDWAVAEAKTLTMPWYEVDSEKKAARVVKEIDVQAQVFAFIKRITKTINDNPGVAVKHRELLDKLAVLDVRGAEEPEQPKAEAV